MRPIDTSRGSLPHLQRLRSRRDIGSGGIAVFGAAFIAVMLSSTAQAAPVSEVVVSEQPNLDVTVEVKASAAPTFQIFRLPGQDAFAVELPGADLSSARKRLGRDGVLLERATVEAGSGAPRVVVRFHGEVDYDAKTRGGALHVVFSPLGDKQALKRAADERRGRKDARAQAERDLSQTQARIDQAMQQQQQAEQQLAAKRKTAAQAIADLDKKARSTRAQLANLEKRRTDEQSRISKIEQQRKAEGRALELAKKSTAAARAEHEAVRADIGAAKKQLAQVRDEVRLAKERSELKKVQSQRQAEEKRLAEARSAVSRADQELQRKQKDAKTAADRARAESERASQLAKKAVAEQQRAQAAERKRQQVEAQLATLLDRQTREQDHVAQLRKAREAEEARTRELEGRNRNAASRVAALDREIEARTQRLANLDGRVKQAETRLASAQQAGSREQRAAKPAPTPSRRAANTTVAYEKRRNKPQPRISVAPTSSQGAYGFGGRSVDLDRRNNYEATSASEFDRDEPGRGTLSHITVRRAQAGATRVGVRVDGGARYSIARRGQKQLVLTLYDTRAANLDVRRILDARDLDASVLRVLPAIREGQSNRVELTIELRDPSAVKVGADDAMLWLHVGNS
jgi:hypothetical protein